MMTDLPRCRQFLEQGITQGLHIGAQVCVSHRGQIVAEFSVGRAREGRPLRPEHRILWMSAGKPLTAIAIAQLWEQGRVAPGDPVAQHIPEFASHGKDAILVQHLLTHTHAYQPPAIDWPRLAWNEVIEQICNARIPKGRKPGEYAAYAPQTTWYLLAEIISRITGEPFYTYVEREVLRRAGCTVSSIGLPAGAYAQLVESDEIALLHDTTQTARDRVDLNENMPPVWPGENEQRSVARNPGGGSLGTAGDLCRFYTELDEIWNGNNGTGLLKMETLKAMTSRVRVNMMDHAFKQRVDWGLGFLINSRRYGGAATPYGYGDHASDTTFGHGGVQSTSAWCDPENHVAAAITYNGLPGEAKHQKRSHAMNTLLYEELGLTAKV